uniref:Uncharacterized protein n=1 Tax=Utricularia reniformis TaxID=192314 RepID=A0A1Y0B3N0_9LAMI|nr:hypothetical protein AEK19_MT0822 [Utricularia reniformis]YP_009382316.1 hypothetical protein AEK19_MT1888 [Utricularia reniformis]ART31056.1 hypothetical protein AEK19_MT0822 [Utricularia reniformis]ART32056.1 hypothetical protein AEK19_MT1888 [Utricularia reniformis]
MAPSLLNLTGQKVPLPIADHRSMVSVSGNRISLPIEQPGILFLLKEPNLHYIYPSFAFLNQCLKRIEDDRPQPSRRQQLPR